MPRKKIETTVEETPEVEETLEVEEVEEVEEEYYPESEAKQVFRELIAKYKEQNPVKYAQKKEALERKLNAMK